MDIHSNKQHTNKSQSNDSCETPLTFFGECEVAFAQCTAKRLGRAIGMSLLPHKANHHNNESTTPSALMCIECSTAAMSVLGPHCHMWHSNAVPSDSQRTETECRHMADAFVVLCVVVCINVDVLADVSRRDGSTETIATTCNNNNNNHNKVRIYCDCGAPYLRRPRYRWAQ